MYVWVYACMYVCGVCTCMYRSQKSKSGTLFYCSPLCSVKKRSLIEPGARLVGSKPAMDPPVPVPHAPTARDLFAHVQLFTRMWRMQTRVLMLAQQARSLAKHVLNMFYNERHCSEISPPWMINSVWTLFVNHISFMLLFLLSTYVYLLK